jgi:plastocyanin
LEDIVKTIWIYAAAAALTLGTVVISAQRTVAADSPTVEVKIDNFSFTPAVITVKTGTQITWINGDDIPHTVVSDDRTTFKSKVLDTEDKFTFTASKPGTYPYFCSIHPKMTGKLVVE